MAFIQKFNFDAQKGVLPSSLRLSICLKAHGFSFSIVDNQQNIHKLASFDAIFPERLSEIMSLIREIFTSSGIHTFGFSEVRIIFPVHKHVWIPNSLYKGENAAEYLRFTCHIENDESIFSLYSKSIDAYSIFALNSNLYSAFKIVMPSAKFQCQHLILAEKILQLTIDKGNTLLVNVRSQEVDICACKGKQFIFNNTFCYQQLSDLIYFVLNVQKQLKLSNTDLQCFVGGEVDSGILESIRHFIPSVSFIPQNFNEEISANAGKEILAQHFLIL